ncbi:hypothetical protein [Denitromonas sp.]|uniref:hypothetical protein n=1 Tax=Denitromonas sp. TaxID=2734609 RepID=UPI002FDEED22
MTLIGIHVDIRRAVRVLALCAMCVGGTAWAQSEVAAGPLDGMVFVGKIGPKGDPNLEDELHFQDGEFWSVNCIKCGFQPANYWIRKVGSRIHFRGELTGERGSLAYQGEVIGDRVEVSITWRKSRWYWQVNKELEFAGVFKPKAAAFSVKHAIDTANNAQPAIEPVCSR